MSIAAIFTIAVALTGAALVAPLLKAPARAVASTRRPPRR
jgi:hypothetical protein